MSQPRGITPQWVFCRKYSLNPFDGKLVMSLVLWPIGLFLVFMAFEPNNLSLAVSCIHWPFWPIHHLTNPQANTPFLGLGGPSGLPGASDPSIHHQGPWPHPFDYGVEGLTGPFGPIRPPIASMSYVDQPEPILAPDLISPKNGHKDPRTQIGHFQPLASGNHQRPPAQAQKSFPSIKGKDSPSPMYSVPRIQEWCIYGIIYHYAPIFLINPMVMVSGPNYAISNKVPKSITHFRGSIFGNSVFQSLAATRAPFKDPNHLALQELGCTFFQDYSRGSFKSLLIIQSAVKA
ncbi:hypothetical protein O181_078029 [Austropuccinia psidii MF-1]|uniref:Uncharacterized protein n=1 Tax=Austropuccinia psidii MF-1 TaxID=1389203 RepID=A0A9Q3IGW8_9BASI|nr:hypothetical protein [Austropuccinia psidii MF-1]